MTRYLGAHLSVAKGLVAAGERILEMGGNSLQIFSGSPRGWARKSIEHVDTEPFLKFQKERNFGPLFIHALYLVNLVGGREELVQNSVNALIYDLRFSSKLQGSGVVVHLGSHLGNGYDSVFETLVERVKKILKDTPSDSMLLIENSAGQQGKLCSSFEDLRRLFDACASEVNSGRLGLCLDTCHAHANGYKLADLEEKITTFKLWDVLKLIHLNDSRDPFGSGRDRHENIGEGSLGKEEIRKFLHTKPFESIPIILEVPGFDGMGPDKKNIQIVLDLLEHS